MISRLAASTSRPSRKAEFAKRPGPGIGVVTDGKAGEILICGHHHGQDWQVIGVREIKVALVMRRTAENRPGAISHQDEIRDEDREFPVRDERMLRRARPVS